MSGRCSHAPKACFRSGALSLSLHSRADGALVGNAGRPGALVSGGGLGFLCWSLGAGHASDEGPAIQGMLNHHVHRDFRKSPTVGGS